VRQQALEYRLCHGAMMQTGYRNSMDSWHVQGMYVITPSGKVIAGGNRPMDLESTLVNMRRGLEIYAAMPREERLLSQAPHPRNDRMFPECDRPRPPAGGLILRSVARNLDKNAVAEGCDVAPQYYQIDRLWYTREEAVQFLPETLQPGAKKEVTGPVFDGMIRLYLLSHLGSGSHWNEHEVKERQLTSEVVGVSGRTVTLRLSGRAVAEATNNPFNWKKYRPELLGYATYDQGSQTFTRFDLVAYGPHNLPASWMRPGGPEYMPFGILFTLNGSNVNDSQVPLQIGSYRWVKLKSAP
jgi:hypothetical protein